MVSDITIGLDIDDTIVLAKIDAIQDKIDAAFQEMELKRRIVLRQIQELNQGLFYVIRAVRMGVEATGQTLDPMQSAVLAMISNTTSIIISTATALAIGSLGVLTGVALGLAAFAYGFSLSKSAKAIADFQQSKEHINAMAARLKEIERHPRGGPGHYTSRKF